uniref:LAGLIDADG/HNH endonuclease n=1 Tax=Parasitella parasitica TaxID=35722 RepID=A0A088S8E6_9FUNG|nr:LAGLIDADG/HNH endonuclease [Parasitella parasitica]AIO05733.1 LAGLIDADG/HNH endonuclease [Parasitella parasitica]
MFNKLVHNYYFNKININKTYFKSTLSSQLDNNPIDNLNPWWITGFCDAESSFTVSIIKSKTSTIGWTISPCFIITLHVKDLELLRTIRKFFNETGSINISGNFVHYKVRSRKDLSIIITHFNKYPLYTSKIMSFVIFTSARGRDPLGGEAPGD